MVNRIKLFFIKGKTCIPFISQESNKLAFSPDLLMK